MKALICSTRMPEYDRECGSKRVYDLVRVLKNAGWDVAYVAGEAEAHDRYARALRQEGILTYAGFDALTDDFLTQSRFDLAILAFWHVAETCLPRIRRTSPGTRIVVDSIDLHFLRGTRALFTSDRDSAKSSAVVATAVGDEFVREVTVYAAADGVLTVSQKEAELIGDLIGNHMAVRCVPLCEMLPRSAIHLAERRGLLFIGNFWHPPNADDITYLVDDILPRVDPALLTQHPLSIVGHASRETIGTLSDRPNVTVVGWVPSVFPYLARARLMTIPLRYGAGTKGKLIEALAVGTPVVSTPIGTEGIAISHGREVFVAADAAGFAKAIESLLLNDELSSALVDRGCSYVVGHHSLEMVTELLLHAIAEVMARAPKLPPERLQPALSSYEQMRDATAAAVLRSVPFGGAVAIISKGDDAFLRLEHRRGEHFPQLPDGRYAGSYPADGAAAVELLEDARSRGVHYLAIPRTSSWWLDHYQELAVHLDGIGTVLFRSDDCTIYHLSNGTVRHSQHVPAAVRPAAPTGRRLAPPRTIEEMRPPSIDLGTDSNADGTRPRVLVCGIYLADQPNNAADEVATLRATTRCDLDQRWVSLGGPAPANLADVTVASMRVPTPKFAILNRLIECCRLSDYDYLLLIDDDIVLPHGFLDAFIGLQRQLAFMLAQPARTSDSYLDHPIVEQQRGVLARQTQFVEIGPLVSMHRSIFNLLLPFDLASSMGWGYENVWAYRLRQGGIKMGIIDAVAVCHGLREPAAHYSWHAANRQRTSYLAGHPHLPLDECFRVLDIVSCEPSHG